MIRNISLRPQFLQLNPLFLGFMFYNDSNLGAHVLTLANTPNERLTVLLGTVM